MRRRAIHHLVLASLTRMRGRARSSRSLWLCSVRRRSLSSDMDCLCGREFIFAGCVGGGERERGFDGVANWTEVPQEWRRGMWLDDGACNKQNECCRRRARRCGYVRRGDGEGGDGAGWEMGESKRGRSGWQRTTGRTLRPSC